MSEKLRWKIAYLLDHSRRFCWTNLGAWATWRSPRLRDCGVDDGCLREGDAKCYCGKFKARELSR